MPFPQRNINFLICFTAALSPPPLSFSDPLGECLLWPKNSYYHLHFSLLRTHHQLPGVVLCQIINLEAQCFCPLAFSFWTLQKLSNSGPSCSTKERKLTCRGCKNSQTLSGKQVQMNTSSLPVVPTQNNLIMFLLGLLFLISQLKRKPIQPERKCLIMVCMLSAAQQTAEVLCGRGHYISCGKLKPINVYIVPFLPDKVA